MRIGQISYLFPAAFLLLLLLYFFFALSKYQTPSPSRLLNQPVPSFAVVRLPFKSPVLETFSTASSSESHPPTSSAFSSLSAPPPLVKQKLLTPEDLKGRFSLVNFFSPQCSHCLTEHPGLMTLAQSKDIDLYGISVRSKPELTLAWLERYGNPYKAVGLDQTLTMAIQWGVVSTPETFIINPQGKIVFHYRGPLSPTIVMETIIPLIAPSFKGQKKTFPSKK